MSLPTAMERSQSPQSFSYGRTHINTHTRTRTHIRTHTPAVPPPAAAGRAGGAGVQAVGILTPCAHACRIPGGACVLCERSHAWFIVVCVRAHMRGSLSCACSSHAWFCCRVRACLHAWICCHVCACSHPLIAATPKGGLAPAAPVGLRTAH